jgi:hypothetical protein
MSSDRSKRRKRRRVLIASAALCTFVVGCTQEAPPFATVSSLSRAIRAADVECTISRPSTSSRLVKETATCKPDEVLRLFVFRSPEAKKHWLAVGPAFGPTAIGPNWAVTSADGPVIERVVGVLNAEEL